MSFSAVYRNLVQLEVEEQIRRYTKSGTQEAFYKYIAADHCKDVLHMKCVKCRRTFPRDGAKRCDTGRAFGSK
ncbi:transcriptional repressor [Anaerotruncus colihominis]|uniref:Uncharacterized protein n=1 Tax=Anaerotruncus colihominis TaxID=169435 RepID=A0A1Y4EJK6_9FIRM|nr:transcriptional repressor [Anaerotruncus colihominis]OUO68750.1 hypothetical protein B5F55_00575 [Anaerotruncus colihominis]OUP68944.1 hypothetical protein B5F11_11380 [Anaerotruncus colihominis]OUP73755.1 hypothetical protein B5F10_10170 [Anaerotruncus colihominis]RGE70272.1 hypothetical protein DXC40_04275 [Anaerotruncus colihominis]